MICPSCSTENSEDSKFCMTCGQRLIAAPTTDAAPVAADTTPAEVVTDPIATAPPPQQENPWLVADPAVAEAEPSPVAPAQSAEVAPAAEEPAPPEPSPTAAVPDLPPPPPPESVVPDLPPPPSVVVPDVPLPPPPSVAVPDVPLPPPPESVVPDLPAPAVVEAPSTPPIGTWSVASAPSDPTALEPSPTEVPAQTPEPVVAPAPIPEPVVAPAPIPEPVAAAPTVAPTVPADPDPFGLAAHLARMSDATRPHVEIPVLVAAVLLDAAETVLVVVPGLIDDLVGVAVVTDRRVLMVNGRRWNPTVVEFRLQPGLTVEGWQEADTAMLTFVGDQTARITAIVDKPLAFEAARLVRERVGVTPG